MSDVVRVSLTYENYIFNSSRTLVPMPTLIEASSIFLTLYHSMTTQSPQPHKSESDLSSPGPHHRV